MRILKSLLITTALTACFSGYSQQNIISQVINDTNSVSSELNSSNPADIAIGQSFIAPYDTDITSVSVLSINNSIATLKFFNNNDAGGTPIYTQTGINLAAAIDTDPLQQITLNNPVSLTKGQNYSFILEKTGGDRVTLYFTFTDPYPNGTILLQNNLVFSPGGFVNSDIAFQLSGVIRATSLNAIPSSSVLSLLLILGLIIGLVITRKSNTY